MKQNFPDPITKLPLSKKLELAIPFAQSCDAARLAMNKTFAAEAKKVQHVDRNQLFIIIHKAAEESAKVTDEVLRTSEVVRTILGDETEKYAHQQKETGKISSMLTMILQNSPVLLFPYTDGRRDMNEKEITEITQRAAIEIANKLGIDKKWIDRIIENLVPGIVDPDRLSQY